jgi:RNA polymerase sigma factor (sigma-70 family)
LTNQEILKFQKRAKYVAAKRGYPELADDFAQELLLSFVEKPDRGATFDQLFIDYLRGTYGDTRSACGAVRSRAMHQSISIDDAGYESEEQMGLHDRLGSIEPDSELEQSHRQCMHLFGGREAQLYQAYFVEEQSEKTIGNSMGITESRVSQCLKPMKKEIQDYFVLRECLERIEWDPEYTKLLVDWIRL